jgi:drug/metabolite transporter (DMT)-like permease
MPKKACHNPYSPAKKRRRDSEIRAAFSSNQGFHSEEAMHTSAVSVLCFLGAAVVGAVGQFLYKTGAERTGAGLGSYLANGRLGAGVACYIAVMVLFVAGFKSGGALSVLYPLYATTFIWAALIGWALCGEPIRGVNLAGMLVLIAGLYLMGK